MTDLVPDVHTDSARTSAPRPHLRLSPTRPLATPDRTLHMIGNAHLDPVWLWPWQEGYQEARATFWSAIQRMDEYDDFVFTCDQVVLLSWVEEQDPELFARITERVAQGRWVNAGGWWVEPDVNMPMGESLVRQGLYGQRYLASRFGRIASVGMNVDPFGHPWTLPQILRGQRMDSYVFLRPGPHECDFGPTLFWWESPDGSRVLAYRIPFEYQSDGDSVAWQTEKAIGSLDRAVGDAMVFYGVGNHGGGPTKANIESIQRFDRAGSFGRMQMSSPRSYFDEVLARGARHLETLPVQRDELQHHAPGCYSAHSGIKAWQQRAQRALLSAERWSVVVAVQDGLPYPRVELEHAWKQLLFNQFHDILPGSAIEPAYDDARDQIGEAVAIAKRLIARAHASIARQVDVPFEAGTQPVLVFNPHTWPVVTDVPIHYGGILGPAHVVDAVGKPVLAQTIQSIATAEAARRDALAFRAEVPALGYRLYRIRPGAGEPAHGDVQTSPGVLENRHVRIEIDPATGWISSFVDKRTGVDVVGRAAGAHTVVSADESDTWGHRVISYNLPGEQMALTGLDLVESGPLRARLRIERRWGASTLTEDFVLTDGADSLMVDVTLDWREKMHLLKLRFPTSIEGATPTSEVAFGSIERPLDGAEEPAHSWVDITGSVGNHPAGLVIIATNKHGWDASPEVGGASVGITAVRSPVYSWHDPRTLDPEAHYSYQDQGIQRFRYELVPHAGDWHDAQPSRRGAVLAAPVRAMQESSHPGLLPAQHSYASEVDGVSITAFKGSEDQGASDTGGADLVVRVLETRGENTQARLDLPLVRRSLEVALTPFQLRTFRVLADSTAEPVEVDLLEWPIDGPPQAASATERQGEDFAARG